MPLSIEAGNATSNHAIAPAAPASNRIAIGVPRDMNGGWNRGETQHGTGNNEVVPYPATRVEPTGICEPVRAPLTDQLSARQDGAQVAEMIVENRNIVSVSLGGRKYKALIDSGAMISLVGSEIAERFRDRLTPSATVVRGVNGGALRVLGRLKLWISIDGKEKCLEVRAIGGIDHQIIFGMDFCRLWQLEIRFAKGLWRALGGEFKEFASQSAADAPIVMECAGISRASEIERECVKRLVESIVPPPTAELGFTDRITHKIEVLDTRPVRCAPRRMSPRLLEVAQEEVRKMCAEGVIERSTSEWCSAPVIVTKSGGGHRFCVDFRELNKVTRPDAYPMPSVDSILDRLRGARFISKIDLKQAYFQVILDEDSRKYTAFAVPGSGLWQFTRLAFGLINGPATFSRLIDSLFGPECQPHVFGYLDDVIVITKTFTEHLQWLEFVLRRIVSAGLAISHEKSEFCCEQVAYLGYLLDEGGLRPNPDRIAPVLEYPPPRSVKQLRRFLGMVGWYSRFIEGESEIKIPLTRLLRKDSEWEWGERQQEAFEKLKEALTTAPVLARPDFSRRQVEPREGVIRIDPVEWQDRLKRLDALRDLVARHIDAEQERQKNYYDKRRRGVAFQIGDLVLRKLHSLSDASRGHSAKLAVKYAGPFKIYWRSGPRKCIFWKRTRRSKRQWHTFQN